MRASGQGNRSLVDGVAYGNEMGRLAVLQLDPQPVEVLVAPPDAVLRQVKLDPRRLREKHLQMIHGRR